MPNIFKSFLKPAVNSYVFPDAESLQVEESPEPEGEQAEETPSPAPLPSPTSSRSRSRKRPILRRRMP